MLKFDDTSVFNLLTATFFWCVILQRTWNLNKSLLKPKKVLSFLSTFRHWNHSLWIWSVCWDMHSVRCMQRLMHYNVSLSTSAILSARIAVKKGCDVFSYLYSSRRHKTQVLTYSLTYENGKMILALTGTIIIIVCYGVLKYSGDGIFLITVPNILCISVTLPL